MKKGVLGILVFLISLCFVAQAFAFNAANRVTIAPNGEGDLLIFPAYFTGGGWENEVTLINTSQTDSIAVHVAVRRAPDSAEKDFLVFLSPTDVFKMIIKQNEQGVPVVETSDGSLVIRNDCYTAADYVAANDGQPYQLELGPGWETGYIAAIAVAQTNLGAPPVDKATICNNYRTVMANILPVGGWVIPDNVLTGTMEIYNTQTAVRGAIKAFALKDYDNFYAPNFGETLVIGQNANNSQIEVDAALVNDNVVVPYVGAPDGQTLFTATFPSVSGAYVGRTASYTLIDTEERMGAFSPPPKVTFWEMTTIVFPQDTTWGEPISRGWVLVDYNGSIAAGVAADGATAVAVNDGVPAIHTVMHTIFGGNAIQGVGWFYAASQMGNILYGGAPVSHYAPVNIPNPPCAPGAGFCNY